MQLLEIRGVEQAIFKSRPNRFLVELADGRPAHLHDPGRLSELLIPGKKVLIKKVNKKVNTNPEKARKTNYDILAVKDKHWIFIHSGFHSEIAKRIIPNIFGPIKASEVKLGKSRIDFLLEDGRPLEVKGCTLMKGKTALFPDAPTERGTRHVLELAKHSGALLFLVFHPPARELRPNCKTDPKFCKAMALAKDSGVEMKAVKIRTQVKTRVSGGMSGGVLVLESMTEIPVVVDKSNSPRG